MMRWFTLAVVVLALSSVDGCIKSRCYQDRDCPAGQLCNTATGACVVPECTADDQCPQGSICQGAVCVQGCAGPDDCGVAQVCIAGRCVLETSSGSGCSCVAAPAFCALDIHPLSQSYEEERCLGSASPTAKLLFFGNTG